MQATAQHDALAYITCALSQHSVCTYNHIAAHLQAVPLTYMSVAAALLCLHTYLLGSDPSHELPELCIAAVLTVWHQVQAAGPLGAAGVGLLPHLIQPPSGHKPNHLHKYSQRSTCVYCKKMVSHGGCLTSWGSALSPRGETGVGSCSHMTAAAQRGAGDVTGATRSVC